VSAHQAQHRLRRSVAQRCFVALIGAAVAATTFSVTAPGSGFAADGTALDAGDLERQRQRDHNAEVARKLDPATATTEQVIAAVTVLDQQIQSQLARTIEAERSQTDATRRLGEHREALATMQPELRDITNALQWQAVRLYLDPEELDNSLRLMRADHFDDAERRRVFDDVVSGDSRDLIEKVRVLRGRQDSLQAEATSARDEAEARKHEREKLYQEVLAGQAALKALQTEWDRRVSGQGRAADNIGDTSALDRAIADQKAKLPPAAPVPLSSNGRMIRPLGGKVNDPFGYLSSRGRMHEGVDLAAATGTPVAAAQGGRVIHSGWEGAYGYSIVIDHGGGLQTRYAHLSKRNVNVGASVSQGVIIALSGATGDVTGPHLHFEVIRNGARVNPANYIPL
jgi:murein DD-endopeptidase MepM/ murein hydrolase activator NlpD